MSMSDQGGENKGGQKAQGRRGRPWFRQRGGEGRGPADNRGNGDGRDREAERSEGAADGGVETIVRTPPPACPLCGKPVTEILSALSERASGSPAHFDCVLASLTEAERPQCQGRITYLGAGVFAVVESDPRNPQRFQIKRKIQYEPRDVRPEWRKGLDRVVIRKR
jgi:hypothetical protein